MTLRLQAQDTSEPRASRTTPAAMPGSTMVELLSAMGSQVSDSDAAARLPVAMRRVHAGDCLVHEGTPAEALYFVGAGTFKIFHTDLDGYEQVLAFAGRGEVLGYDALCMESHPTAVMALEDSSVFVVLRNDLIQLSQNLPAFSEALQRAGSLTLMRSRELADLMAAVASEVRLARFLIHTSQRMLAARQSPRRFRLRMGRRDIASLLGVAHETVSRSFTALAMSGLIHVSDREVEILDLEGLRTFSRSTRRKSDELFELPPQASARRRGTTIRRANSTLHALAS